MTAATARQRAPPRAARTALALAAICAGASPQPAAARATRGRIAASALAEAQTFPYYRVYWVGPSFDGHPLAAVDGLKGYIADGRRQRLLRGLRAEQRHLRRRQLPAAAAGHDRHLRAALQRRARPAAQHARARRARRPSTTKAARSRSTPAGSRSTSSPTRSPTRCRRASELRPAERARLRLRQPARARLLPRPLRPGRPRARARDGRPARATPASGPPPGGVHQGRSPASSPRRPTPPRASACAGD